MPISLRRSCLTVREGRLHRAMRPKVQSTVNPVLKCVADTLISRNRSISELTLLFVLNKYPQVFKRRGGSRRWRRRVKTDGKFILRIIIETREYIQNQKCKTKSAKRKARDEMYRKKDHVSLIQHFTSLSNSQSHKNISNYNILYLLC